MTRLFAALAFFLAFVLVPAGTAQAGSAQVTEFPFTQAVYNTCNDDLVLVNGTLVDSVTLVADRGGVRYDHRVWWKDVRAESSIGVHYRIDSGSVDSFRTRIRNGAETQRSLQAYWLRLKPVDGGTGELRVAAVYAFTSNVHGVTRTFDRYWSTCR